MRPGERHGGAGRPAAEQLPSGNVGRVPDLFGQQVAVAREALERAEQRLRGGAIAGSQLVMRALPGQKRPRPSDSGAVERTAVLVLAVAVAVVAPPARTGGQVD